MGSLSRVLALALALVSATSAVARAESFVIQAGSMGFDTGDPAGFVFTGEGLEISGLFQRIASSGAFTCAPAPCVPGTLVSLGTVFGGPSVDFNLGQGVATIDGVQYGSQTGPPGEGFLFLTGTFTFDAPELPIPDTGADFVTLTAPFLFSGNVIGSNEQPVALPLFDLDLSGIGIARMRLDRINGTYNFTALQYEFEPIPEPATLILVGGGLAGLVAGRKRLRAR